MRHRSAALTASVMALAAMGPQPMGLSPSGRATNPLASQTDAQRERAIARAEAKRNRKSRVTSADEVQP